MQSSGFDSGGFSFSVGASVGGLVLSVLGLVGVVVPRLRYPLPANEFNLGDARKTVQLTRNPHAQFHTPCIVLLAPTGTMPSSPVQQPDHLTLNFQVVNHPKPLNPKP